MEFRRGSAENSENQAENQIFNFIIFLKKKLMKRNETDCEKKGINNKII